MTAYTRADLKQMNLHDKLTLPAGSVKHQRTSGMNLDSVSTVPCLHLRLNPQLIYSDVCGGEQKNTKGLWSLIKDAHCEDEQQNVNFDFTSCWSQVMVCFLAAEMPPAKYSTKPVSCLTSLKRSLEISFNSKPHGCCWKSPISNAPGV